MSSSTTTSTPAHSRQSATIALASTAAKVITVMATTDRNDRRLPSVPDDNYGVVSPSTIAMQQSNEMEKISYCDVKVIGNGSFGVVYQARLLPDKELIAIKKVFQDKRYKNREVEIMRKLNHPNIVSLLYFFYSSGDKSEDDVYLNLVLEFIPETVHNIARHYSKSKQIIPHIYSKLYSYQLLRALSYLHNAGISHRDIKPQNLLIDPLTSVLKLCDFGSAKKLVRGSPNVSYICSRYYRAPELIFGSTDYTSHIDLWSAGCVIAELLLGRPVFPGDSGVNQLVEIIKILGTPTKEQIRYMNPRYQNFRFPQIKAHAWDQILPKRTPTGGPELVSMLLDYIPNCRIHPLRACALPFFDQLRDPKTQLPHGPALPQLFNFTEFEISACPEVGLKLKVGGEQLTTSADRGPGDKHD